MTAGHSANSDPWLVSHRATITEMRPRVLVLNFQNGVSADGARQVADRQIAADGTRQSIAIAERLAPNSWAVTLFELVGGILMFFRYLVKFFCIGESAKERYPCR
jgi:hypothetical protein